MKPVLTDAYISSLSAAGKHRHGKIPNLYLEVIVREAGISKLWRLKYKHPLTGKLTRMSLGSYPDVSLKAVRGKAEEALKTIANGESPVPVSAGQQGAERTKTLCTFESVATDYLALKAKGKKPSANTLKGYTRVLKNHAFPILGPLPVHKISSAHIRSLVDSIEKPTAARMALNLVETVLDYAEAWGMVEKNVVPKRRAMVLNKHEHTRHPAITKPAELAELLRRLDDYSGRGTSVASALHLLVLVPARPAEMTGMRWQDLDLDAGLWTYKVPKTGKLHTACLPTQAVAILRELHESRVVNAKGEGWVFPSPTRPSQPIQRDSLLSGLINGLGYPRGSLTSHGMRSTFRAMARQEVKITDVVVLEMCLGHKMKGPLGDTYAREDLLDERRVAMQAWGDYLDRLRETEAT